MPIDLSGQVALVTGAGEGLGRACAIALAGAGARVAITGRRVELLKETVGAIERAGGKALAVSGDVAVPDVASRTVSTVAGELGPVDILVNNAGVIGPMGQDWEADELEWWRAFEVNVRGAFLFARQVLPGMISRRRGRIVNVSSGAAFTVLPQITAYCASKAAMTQWTKCLAAETAPHGIAVFAFTPGTVRTPMVDRIAAPDSPKEIGNRFRALLREGRDTTMDRCTAMVLFLCSGRADALSGRFIRAQDDEDDLVRRAPEIQKNDLHTVTLRV